MEHVTAIEKVAGPARPLYRAACSCGWTADETTKREAESDRAAHAAWTRHAANVDRLRQASA